MRSNTVSRSDHVASVLSALAGELGLPALALDDNDRATLAFDGMAVTFVYTTEPVELLWLYADLGEIPADGDQAPAFLLQVGLGSWALNRMTIGLDDQGRKVRGYTALPVSLLDPGMLHKTLIGLLEVALPLRQRLADQDFALTIPADSADGATDAPPPRPTNGPGLRA
jgi:hypothetical protein